MTPTQVQSLALGAICALVFAVLSGSLIEWSKWIANRMNGTKRNCLATAGPQATVGLVDVLVTFLVLLSLFFVAAVTWRTLGLPTNPPLQGLKPAAVAVVDIAQAATEILRDSEESMLESSDSSVDVAKKPAVMTQNQFIYGGFVMSAQLLCVLLMTVFITGRTGCRLKKLGWRMDQVASDLYAGFQCFLMMTPIIVILNAVLQGLLRTPYEHPVQEMIKQYPWLLGIAFWQAAIVAPISEEFGFRVLLIGWFESIHFGRNKLFAFVFGSSSNGLVDSNESEANPSSATSASEYRPPWWPVLLSGTLFGLAHFSYGVSWVALIVFGVVLGRLYQVRQSILPVIVVHFLFNAMNVMMMALSILLPQPLSSAFAALGL